MNSANVKYAVPYGYLLNLSLKHLKAEKTWTAKDAVAQDVLWQKILDLSKLILRTLDVQSYNLWDGIVLLNGDHLLKSLQDTIIFDSATGIMQSSPDMEVEMLSFLFAWVDPATFLAKAGFTVKDYIMVTNFILAGAGNTCGPIMINPARLLQTADNQLGLERLEKIFDVLSHGESTINSGYTFITDVAVANFGKKPLVKLDNSNFILSDKSWCCSSFYYALAETVKIAFDSGKNPKEQSTDKKIGKALEDYIFSKFREKGIEFSKGTFVVDGRDGESDMVIETEKEIILVEIKKKLLTDLARSGDMPSAMLDLGSSLLHSQLQAGKIELIIRKNGYIDLANAGVTTKIEFRNRRILSLSVTHYDYNSLQDMKLTQTFLQFFINRTVEPEDYVDEKLKSGLKQLNKKGVEWATQFQQLAILDPQSTKNPYFNSRFFSVGQLLMVLDSVTDNYSFRDRLLKTWHITGGTKNFYLEYAHFSQL